MNKVWLTPAFLGAHEWVGTVHSVFGRVVNLSFQQKEGARLFTLCEPGVPRLPDAACVPEGWLAGIRLGEPSRLTCECVIVGDRALPLTSEPRCGRIARQGSRVQPGVMEKFAPFMALWLEHVPATIRAQAMEDLRAGDGRRWLGLGRGLTPAFDDACVGAMAARRALGLTQPFRLPALERTTEISARYLKLAVEGYFGEALCDVVAALFHETLLARALERLAAIGATSGRDMLAGVGVVLTAEAGA